MKIRWTRNSVRFRITPTELACLERGEPVGESLALPGGAGWTASICPKAAETALQMEGTELRLRLSAADGQRLSAPEEEGVYFRLGSEPALLYFIEKDFPCIHPRALDALEAATETFARSGCDAAAGDTSTGGVGPTGSPSASTP